jgi:hypothetical protein
LTEKAVGDEVTLDFETFTLAGFGKNKNATSGSISKDDSTIASFQKLIFSEDAQKEEVKVEKPSIYTNLFDRFLYQSEPVEQPPRIVAKFESEVDRTMLQMMKSMMLFSALKDEKKLVNLLKKQKS